MDPMSGEGAAGGDRQSMTGGLCLQAGMIPCAPLCPCSGPGVASRGLESDSYASIDLAKQTRLDSLWRP